MLAGGLFFTYKYVKYMYMRKIILIIIVLILVGGGVGFILNKDEVNNEEPTIDKIDEGILDIDPSELIVFEIKKETFSEFQKERAFDRFNNAKNIIEENRDRYISDDNYYAWLEVASVQKSIGDYDRAAQLWKWCNQAYAFNSISPANLVIYINHLWLTKKNQRNII